MAKKHKREHPATQQPMIIKIKPPPIKPAVKKNKNPQKEKE